MGMETWALSSTLHEVLISYNNQSLFAYLQCNTLP
jgi:hypothetical protein